MVAAMLCYARHHLLLISAMLIVTQYNYTRYIIYMQQLVARGELPELVVLLVPFPEHSASAISDASVPPVALECIQVESNVVGHPYRTISISHVLTLTPQHVLIVTGGALILSEQHLLTFSDSMAKSLTSGFVHQSKSRMTHLVPHLVTPAFVLHPLHCGIIGIVEDHDGSAISDCQSIVGIGLRADPHDLALRNNLLAVPHAASSCIKLVASSAISILVKSIASLCCILAWVARGTCQLLLLKTRTGSVPPLARIVFPIVCHG